MAITMDQYSNDRCEALRHPAFAQLVLSILIVIGLLISYLPQHHRIISRGTSEGISPWFVLLGTTSATAGFANILSVAPSRADMACCREVETLECVAGLLGIIQLGVQWISFATIMMLFLVFFRSQFAAVPDEELRAPAPRWQTAVFVGVACCAHVLVTAILMIVFTTTLREYIDYWATFLGVMAAVLAGVQYLPQIWTTYHIKHVGSLSIPMMCIQTPGGFVFTISLYLRLGWAGWSTWGIFLLTACMQGILLLMALYYERKAGEEARPDALDSTGRDQPPPYEPRRRRPGYLSRAYSEGLEEGLPGPYTGHPERYADTPDEMDRLIDREERQIAKETRPLLRPGGIGNPRRDSDYGSTDE